MCTVQTTGHPSSRAEILPVACSFRRAAKVAGFEARRRPAAHTRSALEFVRQGTVQQGCRGTAHPIGQSYVPCVRTRMTCRHCLSARLCGINNPAEPV